MSDSVKSEMRTLADRLADMRNENKVAKAAFAVEQTKLSRLIDRHPDVAAELGVQKPARRGPKPAAEQASE